MNQNENQVENAVKFFRSKERRNNLSVPSPSHASFETGCHVLPPRQHTPTHAHTQTRKPKPHVIPLDLHSKKNQGVSESCSHSRPSQFLPRTPSDWVLFLLFGSDLMSSPHRLHRLFPLVFCWVVCISTTGALFVHNCPPFTWNGSYIYINILKIIFMFVSTFCIFFLVMFIASGFKTCM